MVPETYLLEIITMPAARVPGAAVYTIAMTALQAPHMAKPRLRPSRRLLI